MVSDPWRMLRFDPSVESSVDIALLSGVLGLLQSSVRRMRLRRPVLLIE